MAYTSDMKAAARRISQAAIKLDTSADRAVAAYLFGLAAECALKFVAARLPGGSVEAIQRAHFPELRTALRRLGGGRQSQGLRRLVESRGFMNQWAIPIRYARKEDFQSRPLNEWRDHMTDALNLMEGWS